MNTNNLLKTAVCAALAVALGTVQQAHGLDTDIYLKSQALVRDDSPNVLIILDNSGSMDTQIESRPPYDPSIDYCAGDLNAAYPTVVDADGNPNANSGKPSNCGNISGRLYYSFDNEPPGMSSDDWFASSKNKCIDSLSSLNDSGLYQGSAVSNRIAKWRSGNRGGGWRSLRRQDDGDMTYVDCQADGNSNGQAAADGTYPQNSSSTAYTSSGTAFVWDNFNTNADPSLYASNYMNYWHNAELVTSTTRIAVAKSAVKSIIDANTTVRFGLMVFNSNGSSTSYHGGRVIYKVDTMDSTRRAELKDTVDSITPSGFTPLAETLWEAYRYFSANSVDYGDNESGATPPRDTTAESGGDYISPFAYACQKSYILYVTDGDPTNDSHADSAIAGLTGTACDGSSCLDDLAGWMHDNDINELPNDQIVSTYTIGFGGSISESGLALLQETANQGGGTYFDAASADQLTTALQSVIAEILQETTSFSSPSLSVNAFSKLFNRDEIYFALFKPSNSCGWVGNVKKYKLCTTADITAGRCSNLSDILDADNIKATDSNNFILNSARSYWSASDDGPDVDKGGAGTNMPTPTNRKLYTYWADDYSGLSIPTPGVEVKVASGNAFYDAVTAQPDLLGLPAGATVPDDVDLLVNWMRGADSYDDDSDSSTTTRWALGDLLHSRPAAITYGAELDASGNPDFDKPIMKLFFGTNDGVVHMVNDSTGQEEWAFMPKEMYGVQNKLSEDGDGEHVHGMDGSPTFWIRDFDRDGVIEPAAGDRVYMYLNMRRGGENIYAFDATPSSVLTDHTTTFAPKLMWVIEGGAGTGTGDFARLGQTWSRPLVTRIRVKCSSSVCDDGEAGTDDSESRIVIMFAGGYDTNQDNGIPAGTDTMGNAIYIVDPLTGQRLWWASNDANADLVLPAMSYSIPSDLAMVDSNGDNSTDRLYVGDMGGQIWRIDLSNQINPAGSDAAERNGDSTGYVFASLASSTAQHQRKFFYPPSVVPVIDTDFSTDSRYDLVTIGSGDREDPLDFLTSNLVSPDSKEAVHNRIYAIRDDNFQTGKAASSSSPWAPPAALTEASLYDATEDLLGTATGDTLQAEVNDLKASQGWFIKLMESGEVTVPNGLSTQWIGEKALAETTVLEGIIYVTTFTPANDTNSGTTCKANEGVAKQYGLNVFTGAGAIDFDGDGDEERANEIGGGIPSEVVIIFRPDGTTSLVKAGGGTPPAGAKVKSELNRTFWRE